MKHINQIIIIILAVVVFPQTVRAEDFTLLYTEVRYIDEGPSNPGVTNYSDLGVCYSAHTTGQEVCAEGRRRIGRSAFSLGGRLQVQDPDWTDRDEFLLGPTLQWKVNKSGWDLSLRAEALIDLQEIDLGVFHPHALILKEWGEDHILQLNLQGHWFYFGSDEFDLQGNPGSYYLASDHQLTSEGEVAYHPQGWKYIYPLARLGYTHVWSSSESHVDGNIYPASQDRGVLITAIGAKGEIQIGNNLLWYTLQVGRQSFDGDNPPSDGTVGMVAVGVLFK